MKIESYKAVVEWAPLWQITEMRKGCIFRTKNTGYHVPRGAKIPEGFITTSFSTTLTKEPFVEINPHPTIK